MMSSYLVISTRTYHANGAVETQQKVMDSNKEVVATNNSSRMLKESDIPDLERRLKTRKVIFPTRECEVRLPLRQHERDQLQQYIRTAFEKQYE